MMPFDINTYALETNLMAWPRLEPNPMYWPSLAHRKCGWLQQSLVRRSMEEVQFISNRAGPQGGIVGKDFDNKEEQVW
jgi:hypothetical protein